MSGANGKTDFDDLISSLSPNKIEELPQVANSNYTAQSSTGVPFMQGQTFLKPQDTVGFKNQVNAGSKGTGQPTKQETIFNVLGNGGLN